jgi:multicomponent Na+:H+ antiporter subunit G
MYAIFADLFALLLVIAGTSMSVIGVLGYYRLPDVFTRLHATGLVGTFGVTFLAAATVLAAGVAWPKALLLAILTFIAGPVTTHALGSAAYRIGLPLKLSFRNDLNPEAPKSTPE